MRANRLAKEASPYLLQHARNPVDWFPWGQEALAEAKAKDKPILLSIGYSACHWCHVMERESFEDDAIARKMNDLFVNVKVDREERPDLDQIYQLVVQLLGRSGGWPLTVFLTPDQKPFFGGTYFPPSDRYGMPGFPKVLDAISEAYRTRRGEIDAQAGEIATAIAGVTTAEAPGGPYAPGPDLLERAVSKLAMRFDDEHGGFGQRPKFPNTMSVEVLLRRGVLEGDKKSASRVQRALDGMRAGGIYDHLGGGFHRYSTDERWLVPHFEKMLYDNALLLRLYADGFRAFGDDERHPYRATAEEIAAYVRREMTSPDGGFYATQDADSEGEEGKFFVWSKEEIYAALGSDAEAADVAIDHFGVTDDGNFEHTGKTVLSAEVPIDEIAQLRGRPVDEIAAALARAKARMLDVREGRIKPFRDEKILASWNGLMIGALAHAGSAFGDAEMIATAARAFAFVEAKLTKREPSGGLRVLRHTKGDIVKGPGFLDDAAFAADAALDLYEATAEPRYVATARAIADAMLAHFSDPETGGFFFTPDDGEKLIHRAKDPFDHAIPSGTSIACQVLLRLGALVDAKYAEPATKELERLAPSAVDNPLGMGQSVCVLDRLVRGATDILIVGARADARTRELGRAAARAYVPNQNIGWLDPTDDATRDAIAALAEGKPTRAPDAAPIAYVCRGRTCSPPIADPAELARALTSET